MLMKPIFFHNSKSVSLKSCVKWLINNQWLWQWIATLEYHIHPFTDNKSAKECEAPVVAEGNDDRKVEDETLRIDSNKRLQIEQKFCHIFEIINWTPGKGLPTRRHWAKYCPSLKELPSEGCPQQMLQHGRVIVGGHQEPPSCSFVIF